MYQQFLKKNVFWLKVENNSGEKRNITRYFFYYVNCISFGWSMKWVGDASFFHKLWEGKSIFFWNSFCVSEILSDGFIYSERLYVLQIFWLRDLLTVFFTTTLVWNLIDSPQFILQSILHSIFSHNGKCVLLGALENMIRKRQCLYFISPWNEVHA